VGFGEFGIVRSTVNMFSVYAGFRLGGTATKYVAEYRIKQPEKAGRILKLTLSTSFVLCILVMIVLLAASPYLSAHSLKRPELTTSLAIGSFLVFFLIYGNILQHALAGFENFKAIAKTNMYRGLLALLICPILTYFWGTEGAIGGLVIVSAILMIHLHILLKNQRIASGMLIRVPLHQLKAELPVLWKFALPGFLTGILITSMIWIGKVFLAQQQNGYSELGLFEAADQWRTLILFLPQLLTRVAPPILSETYSRKSKEEFKKVVSIQFKGICLITLPITVLIISFAEPLASVFGLQFRGIETVIPVLMLSIFFYAMNRHVRLMFDGSGRRWLNFMMHLIWALVFFIGCIELIPNLKAVGFAYAYIIAEATLLLIQIIYVDFILAPHSLRRHFKLFLYAIFLLISSFIIHSKIESNIAIPVLTGLFLLSLAPVFFQFKNNFR
jgi:O-antigen/teichoic acid export membrane protein